MSIVAIFSGVYCGSDEIAKQVAERLGYTLVGDEFLERVAQKWNTTVKRLNRALTGSRAVLDGITHERNRSLVYIKAELADLLCKDGVVYLGPATQLIPEGITHVLKAALIADRETRIEIATGRHGLTPKEAAAKIEKNDQYLADLTQQVHRKGPWDASLYDIKIPMTVGHVDPAIDLLCDAVAQDPLRPTDRSLRIVQDFSLAAEVNLALFDHGHHYCDVSVRNGEVTVFVRRKPSSWGQIGRTIEALKFEQLEDDVKVVVASIEGTGTVQIQPSGWYRKPARTLLVDDEEDYVITLSDRLKMRDIPSEVVYNGEGALQVIETDKPDVMVLDLRMPGIDGMDVLRKVRVEHPDIQVIIVTGHGSEQDRRLAQELGAFEYLEKPVDISVLAETIERASAHQEGLAGDGSGSEDEDFETAEG